MVLVELTDPRAHVRARLRFELAVIEPERVGAPQVADDRLDAFVGGGEGIRLGDICRRGHVRPRVRRARTVVRKAASSARASASRSCTARR